MSDSEEEFASADEGDVDKLSEKASAAAGDMNIGIAKEEPKKDVVKQKAAEKEGPKKPHDNKKGKSTKGGDKTKDTKQKVVDSKEPAAAAKKQSESSQETRSKKGKQKGKGKQKSADHAKSAAKSDDNVHSQIADSSEVSEKTESKSSVESVKNETSDPKVEGVNTETAVGDDMEGAVGGKVDLGSADKSDSDEKKLLVDQASLIKSPSSQSINRPPPDHTDKEEAVLDKLASVAAEKKSSWGWGWGSSILEAATTSVSTFTKEVGEGLHTMIETVESTLNVPNPEELAQRDSQDDLEDKQEEEEGDKSEVSEGKEKSSEPKKPEKTQEKQKTAEGPGKQPASSGETHQEASNSWFSSWGVGNISKMVESTSKNLVTTGLDALETIGKKTFDAINERDPGLKKTRGFLADRGDKPNLSAVLREAKEQEEVRAQQEKESEEARKAHFGSLFDDFQGLAHLEALEMLSNQSEKRVNTLLSALPQNAVTAIKPVLLKVKENFEMGEEEDEEVEDQEFDLLVTDLLKDLNVGTTPDKLVKTVEKINFELKECCENNDGKPEPKELHRIAISGLAELTSKCIEQFHKSGELILMQKSEVSDFVNVSEVLLRLTKVLSTEVGIISSKFTKELNKMESGDEIKVNHLVTNIYLEATNSSSYVQDGFQLLLPVLQQAAIEKSQELDT